MLMEAHEAYRAGNVDTALLKYAMLAELGYEVAQSNVAFILDHGKRVSHYSETPQETALLTVSTSSLLRCMCLSAYACYFLQKLIHYLFS